MSSLESGNNVSIASEQAKVAQERAKVCAGSHQECLAHQGDMRQAYPDTVFSNVTTNTANTPSAEVNLKQIPLSPDTVKYLTTKCAGNDRLLTLAKGQAQALLLDDPTILDDPEIASMFLDDCVAEAEIAAIDKSIETEKEANDQRNTTVEVLSKIDEQSQDLGGRELIAFAQDFLENPDIPKEVKDKLGARFSQIAATLDEMTNVFTDPVSQQAFEQIISNTNFNLGAATLGETFAPVMAQVEAAGVFSAADKRRLRMIVTGSDVQDSLSETVTDENGHTEYRFTEKNKRPIRSGVAGYTEPGGHQIIEAKAGTHIITKDVTGWSGEDIGSLVEIMHYWNATEQQGTTGFIENVYKVDFSVLGDGGLFDPLTIIKFRQVISHMTGGFAGYDGDIENFDAQQQLIQNQSRLMSETMTTFGWENDQAGTKKVLVRLGMEDKDGNPNLDVIKSFGDYTQRNYGIGNPDQLSVVDFLSKMHPEFVAPVSDTERENSKLRFDNHSSNKNEN